MTPYDQAAQLYREQPQPRTFGEDLVAHMKTGWVISTPTSFVMGREIMLQGNRDLIADPWYQFQHGDCWLIYLFAGELPNILDFIPHKRDWIAFQRYGRPLKYYAFDRFTRHIQKQG